jgi:hypothetical protein
MYEGFGAQDMYQFKAQLKQRERETATNCEICSPPEQPDRDIAASENAFLALPTK